jgi:dihydroxyacetone kinase-like predicted kinase
MKTTAVLPRDTAHGTVVTVQQSTILLRLVTALEEGVRYSVVPVILASLPQGLADVLHRNSSQQRVTKLTTVKCMLAYSTPASLTDIR